MKILGIESSCDETSAAVVEDGRKILSVITASQMDEHALYGGVVPEIASRRHAECVSQITRQALEQARFDLRADIDAVAVTFAPGLIGALLVGVSFAKGLAFSAGKPLIPVHHLRGHIAANYLAFPDLNPPFLCLIISGGNTLIVSVSDYTRFEVLGGTLDDAAGEAFDKAARAMGFPYPGGAMLEKTALQSQNPSAYKLPRPKTANPLDFSFSGLKTAVLNTLNNVRDVNINDLAHAFQSAAADILAGKLMLAAEKTGSKTIAVCGGVAANSFVMGEISSRCGKAGLKLYVPPANLCGDNAAMIAAQGFYEYRAGNVAGLDLNACAARDIS